MRLCYCLTSIANLLVLKVTSVQSVNVSVCRDYTRVVAYFPEGTSCMDGHFPNQENLDDHGIGENIQDFLLEHCCSFGGGERIYEDDQIFRQLRSFTGMSAAEFDNQYSSSQKALFWLTKEDTYPDLIQYTRIVQRFSLASIYFGFNGDNDWIECSRSTHENCSVEGKTAWLSGEQECNWAYLSCDRNSFVTEINMDSNILSTTNEFPEMTRDIGLLGGTLEKIDLRNNDIGGTIPKSIGTLRTLSLIDIRNNRLEGTLPNELFDATSLEIIKVGHNSLHGTIPDKIAKLSQLKELKLSFNKFNGDISLVLGNFRKLQVLDILGTEFTGEIPSHFCSSYMADQSLVLRLECPLTCDSFEKSIDSSLIIDSATNTCSGTGFDICSNLFKWIDSLGYGCQWYEKYEDPGCPQFGGSTSIDGISANDACCYCGGGECSAGRTCHETMSKQCINDSQWIASLHNETFSCEWFEDNDEPGCVNTYHDFLSIVGTSDPRKSCCYCSEYCQDLAGWLDGRSNYRGDGKSCSWYEQFDEPGCPAYGDLWPSNDGVSAHQACCYCRGYENILPSTNTCYDYPKYLNSYGVGCWWYEYYDDPGCPISGHQYPNSDGVLANEACCYCGGGLSEFPSATPSASTSPTYSNKPSISPYHLPTEKPLSIFRPSFGSESPSLKINVASNYQNDDIATSTSLVVSESSENSRCYDYYGWISPNRGGCDFFKILDNPAAADPPLLCNTITNIYGVTGDEACCECGGGLSTSSTGNFVSSCTDNDQNWLNSATSDNLIHGYNESCEWLEYFFTLSNLPLTSFCKKLHNGTVFMDDACCICKVDEKNQSLMDEDLIDKEYKCIDLQIPKPWPERNCEWFVEDPGRCDRFGDSEILIGGENSDLWHRTAKDVCCACKGGMSHCNDYTIGWRDSHPKEPYTCNQYDKMGRCDKDGMGFISYGHSARTQCCICGGGWHKESQRGTSIIRLPSNESCIDELNWMSSNIDCSSFVNDDKLPDVDTCLSKGHFTAESGTNASNACCNCIFGYDATSGGGYRGNLLGQMIRVGSMNYTDLPYVYDAITYDLAISMFIHGVAESYGFGLIENDLKYLSEIYPREENISFNDSYEGCLEAMKINLVDICIGPYKKMSISSKSNFTKSLYEDQYILVVRTIEVTWTEYAFGPFSPFDLWAWAVVTSVVLILTILYNCVENEESPVIKFRDHEIDSLLPMSESGPKFSIKKIRKWGQTVVAITEDAVTGFIHASMLRQEPHPKSTVKQFILIAFTLFSFFVIVAYNSSTTASFVRNAGGPEFESLPDILNRPDKVVCHHKSLRFNLEAAGFNLLNSPLGGDWTDTERLLSLESGSCDGVIISRSSLEYIISSENVAKNNDMRRICSTLHPFLENTLFVEQIVIPTSLTLGSLGEELIKQTNVLIDRGFYKKYHDSERYNVACVFNSLESDVTVNWKTLAVPGGISLLFVFLAFIGLLKVKRKRKNTHDKKCTLTSSEEPSLISEQSHNSSYEVDFSY